MNKNIEIFKNYAVQTPNKTAVADRHSSLNYRELDLLSGCFANDLQNCGVKKNITVGVYVTRNVNIMVGILSVLKCGGTFVPVDDAYPIERIDYMIKNAKCSVILTESTLWEKKGLRDFDGQVIFLDRPPKFNECAKEVESSDNDRAFILFTSGTTGNPKGVVHTYGSMLALTYNLGSVRNPITSDSHLAVFSGFTFIAAIHFLLAPLIHGASAYIVDNELKSDVDGLYRFFCHNGITETFLPPSLGRVMARQYDLSGIHIYFAGEKLSPFTSIRPLDATNMYGSTEGVIVAQFDIPEKFEGDIPIGYPTPGTTVRICDDDGKEVQIGETGELLYNSDFMAEEYLDLPDLTAKKWKIIDGKRYFCTGDRVYADEKGLLYYIGRSDDMVKLNGYRVELGEVDSKLHACGLDNCCCCVRNIHGTDKLCCFYEKKEEDNLEGARDKAKEYLASYMIPDLWISIDALPRNANGKVTRRLLPTPEVERTTHTPPTTTVEEITVAEMEKLLEIKPIGIEDSFTAMGGNSISASVLSSKLKKRGISINISDILMSEDISTLCKSADVCYEKIWDDEKMEKIRQGYSAQGINIEKIIDVTPSIMDALLKHLKNPDVPSHINFGLFLLDCVPTQTQIRKCLDKLSEKHEAIRTNVVYQDVDPILQVVTDRKIPLEIYESEKYDGLEECFSDFRSDNSPFSFDLQSTSNIRFAMYNEGEGKSFILVAAQEPFFGINTIRRYLAEFFDMLKEYYPQSIEIEGWKDILLMASQNEEDTLNTPSIQLQDMNKEYIPEHIFTYSANNENIPVVFVHTANTGSEAYYNLARHTRSELELSVVEQFNIYHPDEAVYGIRNIAKKYLEFLREFQPSGPYRLGGWCYGGMIAYEMACLLEEAGEKVDILIMLDSHAVVSDDMRKLAKVNHSMVKRSYFETCELFEDARNRGIIEKLIDNYRHVANDVINYEPSRYHGQVLYFKPAVIPKDSEGGALAYQNAMAKKRAGGYENYIDQDKLEIVITPHEHDLMLDDVSIQIVAPKIIEVINKTMKGSK